MTHDEMWFNTGRQNESKLSEISDKMCLGLDGPFFNLIILLIIILFESLNK